MDNFFVLFVLYNIYRIDLLLLLFSISPVWLALKDSDKGPAVEYSENTAKNTTELFLFSFFENLEVGLGQILTLGNPNKENSKREFNQHFIEKVKRFGKKATWALRPFSIEQTRANIRGSDWQLD